MKTHHARPVFLNLLLIRLPVGGVLSILHRITGVLLVLCIPLQIWFVQLLNAGPQGYARAMQLYDQPGFKVLVFLMVWALIQHSLSGIRHLLLDAGLGYALPVARMTAWISFCLSLLLAGCVASLLWA